MLKRAMWMGTGFAAGVGATVWADYKLRRAVSRLTPASLGQGTADRARQVGHDVRAALADGRAAMRQREGELRRQMVGAAAGEADATDGPGARLHLVPGAGPAVPSGPDVIEAAAVRDRSPKRRR